MKHHKSGSITTIKGGSIQAAAMDRESIPQARLTGPTGPAEDSGTLWWLRASDGEAPIRGVSVDPRPAQAEGLLGDFRVGLRDFDSLALDGCPGVLRVGVNELGWVVYDWIPGP